MGRVVAVSALMIVASWVAPAGLAEQVGQPPAGPSAGQETLQAYRLRGLRPEVVGHMLSAEPGGPIAMAALAVPLPGPEGKASVPVFVEIDGPSFLQNNQADTAPVEVYAYALGAEQAVAGFFAEIFAVDTSQLGETVWQRGLKFYGHLELPAGGYTLRVLVRNGASGGTGLRQVPLVVPGPSSTLLLALFAGPEVRDDWLAVRGSSSQAQPAYSSILGDRALSPAAHPVVPCGREARALLLAPDFPAGPLGGSVEVLEREGEEPQVVATARIDVEEHRQVGPAGLEALPVRFRLPQLEPGEYLLRFEIIGGAGASRRSAASAVVLAKGEGSDRDLLWTDLRWLVSGDRPLIRELSATSSPALSARSAGQYPQGTRVRKLARAYAEVLALLAEGSVDAAKTALLEIESNAVGRDQLKKLELLRAAEMGVARELASTDAQSLLPVLMLHNQLYPSYRSRRLFSLVFHSRAMVEMLAELYAKRGPAPEGQIIAARALASLAGDLQQVNLPAGCQRLFLRALEHDPSSRAALLGLGASLEKYGDYSAAIAYFERLVEVDSGFSQALLRLAVNCRRSGDEPRARELLAAVLEQEGPSWVRSVAYQELARSYVGTGGLARGAKLLEQAIEQLPEQQNAHLLLAYVYDRQQRPGAAQELLDGVRPVPEESRLSARWIYDTWPQVALEEVRRSLARAALQHRPALARALAVMEGG